MQRNRSGGSSACPQLPQAEAGGVIAFTALAIYTSPGLESSDSEPGSFRSSPKILESRGCAYEALRVARDGPIRKSFTFLPDRSCAVSQRGCLPRPDQVSAGFFGFWYLGRTFGYGRRVRGGVTTLVADRSLFSRSSSLAFSAVILSANCEVTCSYRFHSSSADMD